MDNPVEDLAGRENARLGNSGMADQGYNPGAYPLFGSGLGDQSWTGRQKRCLVLDPSHDADPDVRKHADMLWRHVIEPAAMIANYSARRADRTYENAPTDQPLIDALLDDDLIIAVPSFGNPRVFYETALAQAAARPLILMVEEGQDLGFDPRNAEIVTYRLDGESLHSPTNVVRLQTVIREVEERAGPSCNGFRPGAIAMNDSGAGSIQFERGGGASLDRKLDMMRKARARIDIMGIASLALPTHPGMADVLRACADCGVEIRVLQSAPNNPGLISLIGARQTDRLGAVSAQIAAAAQAWRDAAQAAGPDLSLTVRRTRTSLPMANMLSTDRAVVATPYLRSRATAASPTVFATASDPYHQIMGEEFGMLWAEASTFFRFEPRARRLPEAKMERLTPGVRTPLFKVRSAASAAAPLSKPVRTKSERGFAVIRSIR